MNLPERIIGADVVADLAAPLARHGLGKKLVLVCDDITWVALGERIYSSHLSRFAITPYSLGRYPKAEMGLIPPLMEAAASADGLLAVGSGTINDVTKYAANALNKPYIAIATAASMNGYTSAGASLEENGFKQSHLARAPKAVVAEMPIIIAAPRRLARAGLGDTLARSTTEADSLLSHFLLGTPYPQEAFERLRTHEGPLIANAIRLTESDATYHRQILDALLDAGDAMAQTGSSAVASQSEHMVAHTAEMLYGMELRQNFHGEIVAVASIAMGHLQQKMMLGTVQVKSLPRDEEKFIRLFGRKTGVMLSPIYAKKVLSAGQVEAINGKIEKEWPEMKAALQKVMRSPITMERAFMQANLPMLPKHIGLAEDRFNSAVTYAHMTRERFTFLDLAAMTGKRV